MGYPLFLNMNLHENHFGQPFISRNNEVKYTAKSSKVGQWGVEAKDCVKNSSGWHYMIKQQPLIHVGQKDYHIDSVHYT